MFFNCTTPNVAVEQAAIPSSMDATTHADHEGFEDLTHSSSTAHADPADFEDPDPSLPEGNKEGTSEGIVFAQETLMTTDESTPGINTDANTQQDVNKGTSLTL